MMNLTVETGLGSSSLISWHFSYCRDGSRFRSFSIMVVMFLLL